MIVLCVVSLCLLTLVCPQFAFAYDDNEKMMEAGYDITDWVGCIKVFFSKEILLKGALNFLELAGEFFNTITGNSLFTEGIDSTKFSKVYLFVGNLSESLKPVGYLILGMFAGIEALRIAKDSKGLSSQWMGLGVMEAWLVYALKFYILYVLVTNAKALMLAIYGLIIKIQGIIQGAIKDASLDDGSVVFDSVREYINNLTYGQCPSAAFTIFLVCIVVLIVCAITAVYIQVLSVLRLFEIFILLAMSPICLSGAVSSITSSVTRSYIKNFVSAVLQLSIILIIVAIFGPLMSGITTSLNEAFTTNNTGVQAILKAVIPIVTSLSLFLMVKQSRQISDKLVAVGQ